MDIPAELWEKIILELPKREFRVFLRVSRAHRDIVFRHVFRSISLGFFPVGNGLNEPDRERTLEIIKSIESGGPICSVLKELEVAPSPNARLTRIYENDGRVYDAPSSLMKEGKARTLMMKEDLGKLAHALQYLPVLEFFAYRLGVNNTEASLALCNGLSNNCLNLKHLLIYTPINHKGYKAFGTLLSSIHRPSLQTLRIRLPSGEAYASTFDFISRHSGLQQVFMLSLPDDGLPSWTPAYGDALSHLQHLTLSIGREGIKQMEDPFLPLQLRSLMLNLPRGFLEADVSRFFTQYAACSPIMLEQFSLKGQLRSPDTLSEISRFVGCCACLERLSLFVLFDQQVSAFAAADSYDSARKAIQEAVAKLTRLRLLALREIPFDLLQFEALAQRLPTSLRFLQLADIRADEQHVTEQRRSRDISAIFGPATLSLKQNEIPKRYAMVLRRMPHLRHLKALILYSFPRSMRTEPKTQEVTEETLKVLPFLDIIGVQDNTVYYNVRESADAGAKGCLVKVPHVSLQTRDEFGLTDIEWYLTRPAV